MAKLKFKRFARLRLNAQEFIIEDLRMVFRIDRFPGDQYHTMVVDIYNLERLTGSDGVFAVQTVSLDAGYEEVSGELFKGRVTNIESFKEGTESVTRLHCVDTGSSEDDPHISYNSSGSVSVEYLVRDISKRVGYRVVTYTAKPNNIDGNYNADQFFSSAMNELGDSFNFVWYIYEGEIYVYDTDEGNSSGSVFVIDAESGLLETPVLTGIGVNAKLLLEPALKPNDVYKVASRGLNFTQGSLEAGDLIVQGLGNQKVLSVIHSGDTHGDLWITEVEGRRLLGALA